jgi:regulator of cell morphogenesis and NO signaling
MKLEATKTVAEIAVEMPQSIPYFEGKGIDYCCGGRKSLQEACAKAGVAVGEAVRTLEAIGRKAGGEEPDAQWTTLESLIQYLLDKHHAFTREQLALVGKLGAKVQAVHGSHHPEVAEVNRILNELAEELQLHLLKEEHMAFPFLKGLEKREESVLLFSYETFRNAPQQVLMGDHEATGQQLAALRLVTKGYTPPADACVTFRAFYRGLAELEADLHRHIHLENNVLFPMAERLAKFH